MALQSIALRSPMDGKGPAPAAESGGATPARQREALCNIAKAYLREHWQSSKAAIMQSLAADLADPAKQADQAHETVGKMARTLGLTPREADDLESAYARPRAERIARVRAALAQGTVDYEAVMREAKGLFADEDALLGQIEGDETVQRWRVAALQERTAILAILATFAGHDWDEGIQW